MKRCPHRILLFLSIIAAATPMLSSGAQTQLPDLQPQQSTIGPKLLQPLDQSIEDFGPLSLSLRELRMDLRQPTSFGQVYRVPGDEDMLMRGNGALYAVFPRSSYVRTRRGLQATIPAGTVFHIGMPASATLAQSYDETDAEDPQAQAPKNERQDRMITRIGDREWAAAWQRERKDEVAEPDVQQIPLDEFPRTFRPESPIPIGPEVVTNAQYRSRRITELLSAAAEACRAGGS